MKNYMNVNTDNILTNVRNRLETAWYVWEQFSYYTNSSYVDHYTDEDKTSGIKGMQSMYTVLSTTFGSKAHSRLVRGLKNGAIFSFLLDAPSIVRGLREGRIMDVVKNESCNLGILGASALIGGSIGFAVGSIIPGVGNIVGTTVGAGLAYGIAYGLEQLRHSYLPNSYLFHS